MKPMTLTRVGLLALALAGAAHANEAVIRKNLAQRMADLPPIDEVSRAPVPGLWEVRVGFDVFYTDAEGNWLIDGAIIDTKTRKNLTRERTERLTAIAFDALPLKDAFVIKQGQGTRRLAVFADPNCGYCKQLERDLVALPDVTIYTFLLPILGPDSQAKSRSIWCAKDVGKTWRAWMIDGNAPTRTMGPCDALALDRNTAFGRKYRINGTPALVFEDGVRSAGAMPAAEIAKRMAEATAARGGTKAPPR
ncbi:MAG TPA: DsbC family protein [Burkholderiaceae bacterium]|nr:DsbC family protein [Burkholderiaceae bacterium]